MRLESWLTRVFEEINKRDRFIEHSTWNKSAYHGKINHKLLSQSLNLDLPVVNSHIMVIS